MVWRRLSHVGCLLFGCRPGQRGQQSAHADFENDNHFIRVGFGIGNVCKVDERTTANLFIEPQYTVWHDDVGMPRWQIFVGLNLQFATGQ